MANRIRDAFDHINAEPHLIESTKQFLSERSGEKTARFYNSLFPKKLAAVCMVLVIMVGIGGYSWLQTPVSYVSIDVNPSIELALNCFNRVVSTTAYNVEGEEILRDLSLKGEKYTDAIDAIVESDAMNTYLTDENELTFTVAASGHRESELQSGVESCSAHIEHKSQSVSADIGVVSQAHENGFSLGKYYAYLQLAQYDDTVTVDECRDMSMSEIHGRICEHEQDGEHGYSDETNMENDSTSAGGRKNHHHDGIHDDGAVLRNKYSLITEQEHFLDSANLEFKDSIKISPFVIEFEVVEKLPDYTVVIDEEDQIDSYSVVFNQYKVKVLDDIGQENIEVDEDGNIVICCNSEFSSCYPEFFDGMNAICTLAKASGQHEGKYLLFDKSFYYIEDSFAFAAYEGDTSPAKKYCKKNELTKAIKEIRDIN